MILISEKATIVKLYIPIEYTMNLTIRPAAINDMLLIYEWANDTITRQMSFNQAPILLENHKNWFTKVLADSNRYLLIIEKNQIPIGQVRLNQHGVIGISIAPNSRGQRLGLPVLQAGIQYFQNHTTHTKITAYIKPENTASIKIFERAGFVFFQNTPDSYQEMHDSLCMEYHF